MEAGKVRGEVGTGIRPRRRAGRWVGNAFLAVGGLLVAAAALYGAYAALTNWLIGQDRYLLDGGVARLSVPAPTLTPSPTPTATAPPTPTPTPTPTPLPAPPPAPVQIQIPAIGVKRSIIALPRTIDRATGGWTWDTKKLFRSGRSDLVGHWQGSAYPGQEGNMILVGHNYGYGYNGVFVSLGRLRAGNEVIVVNKAGQTFRYRVTKVQRVKWRTKDFTELTQHLAFLTPGGPERVTLVSCAGADVEPFPERVYVVAERAR
ncbi:MAG: class F sortase [Anaerolineae bacterium]|nr:class F sortase [Anaerolineae bacterium]